MIVLVFGHSFGHSLVIQVTKHKYSVQNKSNAKGR